ncbi:hypothetical protein ACYJW8_09880 [Frateuria aurantia]
MSDSIAPLDHVVKLTRLMHAAAALRDWPRISRLSVRREMLLAKMTAVDPVERPKIALIRQMDADIRKQVGAAISSVEMRWKQLKYSRQAVGLYYRSGRK